MNALRVALVCLGVAGLGSLPVFAKEKAGKNGDPEKGKAVFEGKGIAVGADGAFAGPATGLAWVCAY